MINKYIMKEYKPQIYSHLKRSRKQYNENVQQRKPFKAFCLLYTIHRNLLQLQS